MQSTPSDTTPLWSAGERSTPLTASPTPGPPSVDAAAYRRPETLIVDDLAHRLVAMPQAFDVIVLPNLYGDILSDLAAGVVGGLGLCPSGCYGDDYAYFESAHGTAPDIAGQHIINPTATLLSAAMMLEYLGFADEGQGLARAVERVFSEGKLLTPDQGGRSTTEQFCAAVEEHV